MSPFHNMLGFRTQPPVDSDNPKSCVRHDATLPIAKKKTDSLACSAHPFFDKPAKLRLRAMGVIHSSQTFFPGLPRPPPKLLIKVF